MLVSFVLMLDLHLAVWGPFLIISPASTLHNWQQELAKFVPDFKVVPYWGNPNVSIKYVILWAKYLVILQVSSYNIG